MKKYDETLDYGESSRILRSVRLGLATLISDDKEVWNAFWEKELFWQNQKKGLHKTIGALNQNVTKIKADMSINVALTKKLVSSFRIKTKNSQLEAFKKRVDAWPLEEFVTKERLLKLLEKEMEKSHGRHSTRS